MVDALVSLGLPTGDTQDMQNALLIATRKEHESVIRHLIDLGADINQTGLGLSINNAWSALALAAYKGNLPMVQTLINLGADANASAGVYGTALIAATDSDNCNHNTLEFLLASGANVNDVVEPEGYNYHYSAISAAASRADMKAMEMFLDHGATPNVAHGCWASPLMMAACQGNEIMMNLLLERGADVNLCIVPNLDLTEDTGRITALEGAASEGYTNLIHLLVKHGALLAHAREDTVFKTALQCAAYYGKEESVKTLLELGSDPNIVGGTFGSALQAAAARGSKNCLELLLDAGANIHEHHIGKVCSPLTFVQSTI